MTDDERFVEILREVHELLLDLGDLKSRAVIIGGHVLALHALSRQQSAAIQTRTETGITVTRGFTHEPDLLFELDEDTFEAERIPEVLRARGYKLVRPFRWGHTLSSGTTVEIDFFSEPGATTPVVMTELPDAPEVLARAVSLTLTLGATRTEWRVPDAFGLLTMKMRAKLEQRPSKTKDCFDMYVFVKLLGTRAVNAALDSAPARAAELRKNLRSLFFTTSSPGVTDVIRESALSDQAEIELLARDVVDVMAELE